MDLGNKLTRIMWPKGSKVNDNSQLSLYPEAKLPLSVAIAYIEPAGRVLWNRNTKTLLNAPFKRTMDNLSFPIYQQKINKNSQNMID